MSSIESPLRHVVFFDKPAGCTSHDAVQIVKGICRARKAGHCGTLDPAVTGLLVVALDEARKAMPVLMGLDKEYVGTMHLHGEVDPGALQAAFAKFTGTLVQMPPVRSRVKRVERERTVHELELLARDGREVNFRVRCQAGTYIRTLCVDMGEQIGCGAHMTGLRRTGVGPWTNMVPRDRLQADPAARRIPLEAVLDEVGLKQVHVDEETCLRIRHGQYTTDEECERMDDATVGDLVGIYHKGLLHALAIRTEGGLKPKRIFLFPEPSPPV